MEGTMLIIMNMEGTPPNAYDYGGHPAPDGASPTQPYKCGQYVKIKVKVNTNLFISALANVVLTLTLTF
jgi:hypothetical protein